MKPSPQQAPLTASISPRSRAAFAALSLTLAAVGCRRGAPSGESSGSAQVTAESNAPLRTAPVAAAARETPSTLATTGTLMADVQSELTSVVPGRVMQVLVERGARVREGDALIRLRQTDFQTSLAQARATLGQARSRLAIEPGSEFSAENTPEVRAAAANRDMAEDSLRRAEPLHRSGAMSDADFQRVTSQAAAAREQYRSALNGARGAWYGYQQAQAMTSQAQRALEDSTLRAPFSGEVAERRVQVGEYVTPQRTLLTLVKTNPLRFEMQIPQERIADVHATQEVEVHVDAYPDQVFHGTVRYISAAVRQDTRSLVAEAVIPNEEGALRPGLFATARIQLGTNRTLVMVPSRAVLSDSGSHRVFVVQNGRAQERVVTVAERGDREVLIERGVAAGERVATENVDRLADGSRVTE